MGIGGIHALMPLQRILNDQKQLKICSFKGFVIKTVSTKGLFLTG